MSKHNNDFEYICKKFQYRKTFAQKYLKEASTLEKHHIPQESTRKDYRQDLILTIDGTNARDLDDAVSLKKHAEGYLLYVHIADVSSYVRENSVLDLEARRRGNSIYLLDKVIAMFPPKLSNDLCSLNEGEDRCTLSVEISLNKQGEIQNYTLQQGIIRVSHRLSYRQVDEILQNTKPQNTPQQPYISMLYSMQELTILLYNKRIQQGSLDFQFDELVIHLDSNSFPTDIFPQKRDWSYQIIEEFMLITNQVVAQYLENQRHGLFRIHERGEKEKFLEFQKIMQSMGYQIAQSTFRKQKDLQVLLQVSSKKFAHVNKYVSYLLLRTFKQAVYSVENKGHFALAFTDYTHFTSPIRRYSDLLVHRLVKYYMGISPLNKGFLNSRFLGKIAQHISITERVAVDAERAMIKRKSVHFMCDKVGKLFPAIVSGLTHFGIFVELQPYGIEGLVRLADLKGFYVFDAEKYILYSSRRKNYYKLGDLVEILLIRVDIERGFIDCIIQ